MSWSWGSFWLGMIASPIAGLLALLGFTVAWHWFNPHSGKWRSPYQNFAPRSGNECDIKDWEGRRAARAR